MTTSFTASDQETRETIADFLEMGHVDNIIAMFKQEPSLYVWTGQLLDDERFMDSKEGGRPLNNSRI